jgi:hypothetical protein
LNGIALGTPTATTSGTAHDYTIAAGTREGKLMLVGVSLDGTEELLFQLGHSGGLTTSGYAGVTTSGAGTDQTMAAATGVILRAGSGAADDIWYGGLTFSLVDESTNTWLIEVNMSTTGNIDTFHGVTAVSLAGPLTQIRLTSTGTPDDFDAGKINVLTKR